MKRVSDTNELRAEMLKNKDAFIGKNGGNQKRIKVLDC